MVPGYSDEKVARTGTIHLDKPIDIDKIAEKYRVELVHNNWDQVKSTGRNSWKDEFKFIVVRDTVLQKGQRRNVLRAAAEKIKKLDQYKHLADEIDKSLKKYLKHSPVERFLTAYAYRWLQSHEIHPPKDASWYPDLAIEVARKLFRLRGKLKSFKTYLSNPSRRNMLKSIPICVQCSWPFL